MEYWIYLNSKKSGPYSVEQLVQMSIPPTTLVWHEGLTSWVSAVEIPELSQKYSAAPPQQSVEESPVSDNQLEREPETDQKVETENELATDELIEPECESVNEEPIDEPKKVVPPIFTPDSSHNDTAKQSMGMPPHPDVKCPPTYLVWAILTTLCCCQPFGIVAIIYAANVKSKYDRGDVEGAKKNSERAALWVILAFVVGMVTMPLQSLLSALSSL